MMSKRNQNLTTAGCFLAVVVVGGAFLVLPARKEAHAVRAATAELHEQVENLAGTAEKVVQLQGELLQARARVESDFKRIPTVPLSDLMSRLSMNVDGRFVQDWSLAQGMPQQAVADDSITAMVVPWTAEMKSRFEAVFDVLRLAESMNELVRVSSVRMSTSASSGRSSSANRERADVGDEPMVTAAIVFEAVYDPKQGQPGKEQP